MPSTRRTVQARSVTVGRPVYERGEPVSMGVLVAVVDSPTPVAPTAVTLLVDTDTEVVEWRCRGAWYVEQS